jgi:hypothetical protein
MNVSLRKARQIRDDLQRLLAGEELRGTTTVSVYCEDIDALMAAKRAETMVQARLLGELEQVLFALRRAIGRANTESGIADQLAERARLERQVERLARAAAEAPAESIAVLERRLAAARDRAERADAYHVSETLTINVLGEADIAFFAEAVGIARRTIREIDERVLELNVRTQVEIGKEHERLLVEHGIL